VEPRSELVKLLKDSEIVFHLAAKHGGRGYIATHPADVCSNMAIDNAILNAALQAGVKKVIMASSACVYPPKLQIKGSDYPLKETDTDVTKLDEYLSADLEYGWAKVMGEMQLRAFYKQYGLKGASMRFVTAYGPRENETHAIIALIYKALNRQDPFEVWGDGKQERDFTYVKDITSACLLAAKKVEGVEEFNVGTGRKYSIDEVISLIFQNINWKPQKVFYNTSRPVGVYSRVLDITKIKEQLGWSPKYTLEEGLRITIDWYKKHGNLKGISERLLLERN
ncbi:MAG: NAD-dependent epimerase/dehydratase family protein, partial [Nitrososphaeria archaeon]